MSNEKPAMTPHEEAAKLEQIAERLKLRAFALTAIADKCQAERSEADDENGKSGKPSFFASEPCADCDASRADAQLMLEALSALASTEGTVRP